MSNPVQQAVTWLNDPLNWTNPGGILDRLGEHIVLSAGAVALGCLVAWPLGLWLGHLGPGDGRARFGARAAPSAIVVLSNLTLAIPVLATLTILPLTVVGFGRPAVILALAVFAVPPLLATSYTGVREVDPQTRDAALGMGLSGGQLLRRVELPLAVPYLAAGFRTASVQVVATVTLAVFVNGGGLGTIIGSGFGLGMATGGGQILAGGFLVAVLALLVEGLLAIAQRWATPRSLRRSRRLATAAA
jgi:osmoprotectant transport system permease protein